jgi:hypothetical protein
VNLHYFDFVPPPGWSGFRRDNQVRLIPPNTVPEQAACAIIVSPLVPRSAALPPAEVLFEQTLRAECAITNAEVLTKNGPLPAHSDHGLSGVSFDVWLKTAAGIERRLYVLLVDELCYYSINYLSSEPAFAAYELVFWAAVRTIKPFAGRIVLPSGQPFDHFSE